MNSSQRQPVGSQVLTIPNVLSGIRLLLVPVFLVLIVLEHYVSAFLVLTAASLTDYLDGYLARRLNQISRLGQLLDPAADRLYVLAALVGLAITGVIPWWLVAVIVGRDVLLLGIGIALANFGYGPLPVHHLGKVATFALFYALPILLLAEAFPSTAAITSPIGWAFALWGTFLYWWAGVIYALEAARVIRIPDGGRAAESDTLIG